MTNRWMVVLALSLVGCAAFNYGAPQGPRYAGAGPPSPSPGPRLRVATFNVQFGVQVELAISELSAVGPLDVVLLQEMDAEGTRQIAEALGMRWVYYPASIHGDRDFGNAVLSRWPIAEDHKVLLPHRSPFGGRARVAVSATIDHPYGAFFVSSVHNETVLLPLEGRLDQAAAVLDDAGARYPELPGLIAGDFNTAEPHAVERTVALHELHGLRPIAPGPGEATADSPLGPVTLDLMFARDLGHVVARGVAPSVGASDHRVVWVELSR